MEGKSKKYTIRKAGEKPEGVDCVHLAKSKAEERKAQLWRNLPTRSYMVTDYAVPAGEEKHA